MSSFDSDKTPLFSNIEHLFITYAVCHLASMTSAVSNPILYGFMNENFRREFKNIWLGLKKCVYCCKNDSNLSQPPEASHGFYKKAMKKNVYRYSTGYKCLEKP